MLLQQNIETLAEKVASAAEELRREAVAPVEIEAPYLAREGDWD